MTTINQKRQTAMLELSAVIAKDTTDLTVFNIANGVQQLAKIAKSLHRRYKNSCSYEWAMTEKYMRATDRLEEKATDISQQLGVKIDFQCDPRGWPIIVTLTNYETRLG